MTGQTTSAEWVSALSLGVSSISLIALAVAFADADLAYFDPRPALLRAVDRVLVELVNARYALRDAVLWVAALLLILTAPKKGVTHV